ncbi:MAG: matrixin family metalloprotease [Deltaproteobacteria bacterium]|nr:MAG: matrixin family metalloprotease [Deltaproteobacteria bacterium]
MTRSVRALGIGLALAQLCCAGGSKHPAVPHIPTYREYFSFKQGWTDELLEPNYLPFMLHRHDAGDAAGDWLYLCRWTDSEMPLTVHVADVEIPDALQGEFTRRDPAVYTAAVRAALATWEEALEGVVRFRIVEDPRQARLRVVLQGAVAPVPEPMRTVFGHTPLSCDVRGHPDPYRFDVEFRVQSLKLWLADEYGLLTPDQFQWIALHEIGHALGMKGHSPIPADLMFPIVRNRMLVNEGLSTEDVDSFLSLYRLPNGTVYGRVPLAGIDGPKPVEPGTPQLTMGPYVDSRLGFELRTPLNWVRVTTPRGMMVVHGTTWDPLASFQVIVERYPTIEAYLDRYGPYYRDRGRATQPANVVVNGRRAIQLEIAHFDEPRTEQITFIQVGDGRLMIVIADAPREQLESYRPWFTAALASLRITDLPGEGWPAKH